WLYPLQSVQDHCIRFVRMRRPPPRTTLFPYTTLFRSAGRSGVIVNISSIAAFKAVSPEKHVGYDVAKAGVAHMTRVLAHEWASDGIRVNAVGPGYTDTLILQGLAETAPEMVDTWRSQTPYGRLIEPREIAAVVCFLASE